MKKIFLFFIACIGMMACSSDNNTNESLQGTWALHTIVDLSNNESRFPRNFNGEEEESTTYQLHVISSDNFKGKTLANEFQGNYSVNGSVIDLNTTNITEVLDPLNSDAYFFIDNINSSISFQLENNQLKLFSENYCLIFNSL